MKPSITCLIAATILSTSPLHAGVVKEIVLSKEITYRQTGPAKISHLPANDLPWSFFAEVKGDSRDALATLSPSPGIKLPATSKFAQLYKLTPALGLGDEDDASWNFGYVGKEEFDNWGTRTKGELDKAFPSGNYVFTVQGKTINLSLPKDSYPPAPVIILKGGRWEKGAYRISAGKSLSIGTGIYKNYGKNPNDYLFLEMEDDKTEKDLFDHSQVARKLPGGMAATKAKSHTRTIPAGTLKKGRSYVVAAGFGAVVSYSTALPKCLSTASYGSVTELTVIVE